MTLSQKQWPFELKTNSYHDDNHSVNNWNTAADDIGIPSAGEGFRGITLAMNKRSEQEVDALIEHTLTLGASLLKPAQKVFWGGYSGYIQDLDGHTIEIAYNPFWAFDENGALKL